MRRTVGLLVLISVLAFTACESVQDFVSTTPDEYLTLTSSTHSIPADGQSQAVLTANLASAASDNRRVLLFRASHGTLPGGVCVDGDGEPSPCELSVRADLNGHATALLTSGTAVGLAQIDVTVAETSTDADGVVTVTPTGITRAVGIDFSRAYADGLSLAPGPDDTTICIGGAHKIIATLQRRSGRPSDGTRVDFSVSPAGSMSVGSLSADDADSTADVKPKISTAIFSPNSLGLVTITARVTNPNGAVVTATLTLRVESSC